MEISIINNPDKNGVFLTFLAIVAFFNGFPSFKGSSSFWVKYGLTSLLYPTIKIEKDIKGWASNSSDPACWPERWRMPRQRIDVRAASHFRSSSGSISRTCKETIRRRCGRSHSDVKSVTVSPNTKNENRAKPLSLASVKCMNWTCVPQKVC